MASIRLGTGWVVALALGWGGAVGAQALDPPRSYLVSGTGVMTLQGAHCCGATQFTGRFEAAYGIESSGSVTLARVSVEMDDLDVLVDVFLGLWVERIPFRCTSAGSDIAALGWVDASGGLSFPAGALTVEGLTHRTRFADGTCDDDRRAFSATNNGPASAVHDPLGNVFRLNATFHTTLDGDPYVLTLSLDGRFDNRPPQAVLGIVTPQTTQYGCPAYWRWTGQEQWELVAEANGPGGLKGLLASSSTDPDGAWASGDVPTERWFAARDGGSRAPIGDGRQLGPVDFEFGPVHRIELLAVDHAGAASAAACEFRVIDTTPPVVTAPPALTLGCSEAGGATPAGSPELQAFLAGATATDLVDPAPLALAALLGGAPVGGTTLFPQDGIPRAVTFRFRDAWNNEGAAGSSVTVLDQLEPALAASLAPSLLPADGKWWVISASLAAADDCGGPVALSLVSIASNAPAYDAEDVLDAAYGSDDRSFVLRARVAAPGVPRVYEVTYRGLDASGNASLVTATVKVAE